MARMTQRRHNSIRNPSNKYYLYISSQRVLDFASVLTRVGDYGRFQKILMYVFFNLVNVYGSLSYWGQIFVLLVPNHKCAGNYNSTSGEDNGVFAGQCSWSNSIIEFASNNVTNTETHLPARGFPVYLASFFGMGQFYNDVNYDNATQAPAIDSLTCESWEYDYSMLFKTVATENNWVCQESWKVTFAHTCYWIGSTIGYLIAGFILDSLGRKISVGFFATTLGVSHILSIFAPNYPAFVFCRLLSGMSALPMQSSSYALVVELIGPSKRKVAAVLSAIYWLGLGVVFPWMTYVIRDWRIILVICSSPFFVIMAMLIWWVPESPSWLMGRGDDERAKLELVKISKINGTYNESFFDTLKLAQPKITNAKPDGFLKTTISLVGTQNVRKNTLLMFIAWIFISMSYHGVNLSQSSAGSQVFLIYSLGSLLEIPVGFLHLFLVDRVGRRWPIILSLALIGVVGPATSFINSDSMWVTFSVSILIRGIFSLAYNIFFQLANELFPTSLRGRGVCLMRMLGDIGTSVAPFIISAAKTTPALPVFVFSAFAIVAGIMTLWLPETLNQPLPQTVQDAEEFGLDQVMCFCPIFNSKKPDPNCMEKKVQEAFGVDNPGFTKPNVDESLPI